MDLQIKYWNRGIDSDLDDAILSFFQQYGYKHCSMGWDFDGYREIVFDQTGDGKFDDKWIKKIEYWAGELWAEGVMGKDDAHGFIERLILDMVERTV